MSLDLYLVRHGVTDWNESGRLMGRAAVALNARGRAEAEAVAGALAAVPVRAVLASPQTRAQETAAAIAAAHALPVVSEADLAEVWVTRWQGKTFAEIQDDPDLQRYAEDPTFGGEIIEPADAVQQRVVTVAERLRPEGGSVVLVSHGDPVRLLLAHYLRLSLGDFRRLEVSTGSVSLLRLGSRREQVVMVNWRPDGVRRE